MWIMYRRCHYCTKKFKMGEVAAFFSHEARCSREQEELLARSA